MTTREWIGYIVILGSISAACAAWLLRERLWTAILQWLYRQVLAI